MFLEVIERKKIFPKHKPKIIKIGMFECDNCKIIYELNYAKTNKRLKNKNHYCCHKCLTDAIKSGQCERVKYKLEKINPKEYKKRHKICINCLIEYCDITRRNLAKTCSIKCQNDIMVQKRKLNGSYVRTEGQNKKLNETCDRLYGIDRKTKQKLKTRNAYWNALLLKYNVSHWTQTPEGKEKLSNLFKGKKHTDEQRRKNSLGQQKRLKSDRDMYCWGIVGKRKDINDQFFRSKWEANIARIFNYDGILWEYESITFQLSEFCSYTPDFKIGNVFVEVKGRWTEKATEKVSLFKEKYSEIQFKIIDEYEYKILREYYRKLIPNWED